MKISEMIINLQEMKRLYGDLDCWYASDDEGNEYRECFFGPSIMYVDENDEVHGVDDIDEDCQYKEVCCVN